MRIYNIYNDSIKQYGELRIEYYKNGNVKYWEIGSKSGVWLCSINTSPLVLIGLFKVWEIVPEDGIK